MRDCCRAHLVDRDRLTSVVVLANNRVFLNIACAFNSPVVRAFLVKTASIADELMYLAVFVLAGRDAVDFVAVHPSCYFTAALIAFAMSIHGLEEPYAALEAESTVGECAYRAYIDDIAREIIVDGLLDEGTDLRMVATADDTVYAVVGQLIGSEHAAVAQDATRHVQLDIRPNIDFLKSTTLELVACIGRTMLISKVLQMALTSLIANRAIEWVVEE